MIQFCRILVNSRNYLGNRRKVSISLSENKILEIMSQTTFEFATKFEKFKYSVRIILHYFANLIKSKEESHENQVQREPEQQIYVLVKFDKNLT